MPAFSFIARSVVGQSALTLAAFIDRNRVFREHPWLVLLALVGGAPAFFIIYAIVAALIPRSRELKLKESLSHFGFVSQKGTLLKSFPVDRSQAKGASSFPMDLGWRRGGTELLVFDYKSQSGRVRTVVALRGNDPESLLPLLGELRSRAEVLGEWMVYSAAGKGSLREIREVVDAVPYVP